MSEHRCWGCGVAEDPVPAYGSEPSPPYMILCGDLCTDCSYESHLAGIAHTGEYDDVKDGTPACCAATRAERDAELAKPQKKHERWARENGRMSHDDPDNSGQCVRCRVVLDSTDPDYDKALAEGPCPPVTPLLPQEKGELRDGSRIEDGEVYLAPPQE
jgi:hypothetical protein